MALRIESFDVDVTVRRRRPTGRGQYYDRVGGGMPLGPIAAATNVLSTGNGDSLVSGAAVTSPPIGDKVLARAEPPSPITLAVPAPVPEVSGGMPRFISPPIQAPAPAPLPSLGAPASARPAGNGGFKPMFKRLQLRSASPGEGGQAAAVHRTEGRGRPLDDATRRQMEGFFGADLGDVRVHADAEAAQAAASEGAEAYTIGRDIYFGEGKFDPASAQGKALLGHELTHVLQQRGRGPKRQGSTRGSGEALETEAQTLAQRFEMGATEVKGTGLLVNRYLCTYSVNRPATDIEIQRLEAISRGALKVCEETLRARHPDLLEGAARTLETVEVDIDTSLAGHSDEDIIELWGRRMAAAVAAKLSNQSTPTLAAAAGAVLKQPVKGTGQQPAKTNITVTTQTFDIEADDLDGAAAALQSLDEWGKTRWNVTYDYEATDGVATSVTATARITVQLPRWTTLSKQPRRVQAEWNRMLTALRRHENEHVRIARERISRLAEEMAGKPESELVNLHAQCLQELDTSSEAYDTRTAHGQTDGVTLDLKVTAQPKDISIVGIDPSEAEARAVEQLMAGADMHGAMASMPRVDTLQPFAVIQRSDDGGGGMSSSQGTSAPGTAPVTSTPTPAQKAGRERIDEALKDFSQRAFRRVPDWTLARADEKIRLIEQATDLGLFWVGPDDEDALERCWSSFGPDFQGAVEATPHLWTRSIFRGADPENIPQTRGKYEVFKTDIIEVVRKNLEKNEDRIVAEMAEFGLQPPYDLLRLDNPARKRLDLPAPVPLGGPTIADKLKEQARLAKVVLEHKRHLERLSEVRVGIDLRRFDPGNPTLPGQDIVLWDGMTSWEMVKQPWDATAREIALIFSAWPALYAADVQGTLSVYASQSFTPSTDPFRPDPQVAAAQEVLKQTFTNTLRNINSIRSELGSGADPQDFTPVHRALFSGEAQGPSGQRWSRAIYLPMLNDEKEVKDDITAAAKFAIDVALMVAMVAGVIGTMGGAAIAVGVAGASALKANAKADSLSAARGAGLADSELVTKAAVTATEAEAQQAKLEFAFAVVSNALMLGVETAAARIRAAEMQKAMSGMKAEAEAKGGADLRQKLGARQRDIRSSPPRSAGVEDEPPTLRNPNAPKAPDSAAPSSVRDTFEEITEDYLTVHESAIDAYRSYQNARRLDPTREVGLWADSKKREWVVGYGHRRKVLGPYQVDAKTRETWTLEQHYHPSERRLDLMARVPSDADFRNVLGEVTPAKQSKSLVSLLDWNDPFTSKPRYSWFGFDPAEAKPYWVRYADATDAIGGEELRTRRFTNAPWQGKGRIEYELFLDEVREKQQSLIHDAPTNPRIKVSKPQ